MHGPTTITCNSIPANSFILVLTQNFLHLIMLTTSLLLPVSHEDFEIIISSNFSWKEHYVSILSKAYQTLGLLRQMFSHNLNIQAKKSLYVYIINKIPVTLLLSVVGPLLLQDIACFS